MSRFSQILTFMVDLVETWSSEGRLTVRHFCNTKRRGLFRAGAIAELNAILFSQHGNIRLSSDTKTFVTFFTPASAQA
jgi:hypothetical protein